MAGKRLFHSLRLRSFLSYGLEGQAVELGPLNVLIGPNATGKSNLVQALAILRACPADLAGAVRRAGGIRDLIWKGHATQAPALLLGADIDFPDWESVLAYSLELGELSERVDIVGETICAASGSGDYYVREGGDAKAYAVPIGPDLADISLGSVTRRTEVELSSAEPGLRIRGGPVLARDQSILSQLRDPVRYPEITYLGRRLPEIRIYRNWNVGGSSPLRTPQRADLPGDFLLEDASNLALVLNDLEHRGAKEAVSENLRQLYPRLTDITGRVIGGTVLLYFHEDGLEQPISAARASDGVLRFLCLLAILCHPTPPPLICIEEPELGLHPDVMSALGELLVEASQRTQLIVTTHSDVLVSALSDVPEAVLVCERDDKGTQLRGLEKDKLAEWLEKYSLGELWRMGEIGGTLT